MLVGWGMHNVWKCLFRLIRYEMDCLHYLAVMMIMIVVIILKLHAFSISWLGCQINVSAVLPSKSVCMYVRQGLCVTSACSIAGGQDRNRPYSPSDIKLRPSAPLESPLFPRRYYAYNYLELMQKRCGSEIQSTHKQRRTERESKVFFV